MGKNFANRVLLAGGVFALAAATTGGANAQEEYRLTIRDHRFEPTELVVPAGEKIKLLIDNRDPTAEEFESHDLNREKIIPGGATGIVFVGPLDPGRYEYFGEFNPETAKGAIVAK